MATSKYLDASGLSYLWSKITSYFDAIVFLDEDDGTAGDANLDIDESRLLPKCIIPEEDGLYQDRNGIIYPVSHPPLSTQPSILPQSFGINDIYEVLVRWVSETFKVINGVYTNLDYSTIKYNSVPDSTGIWTYDGISRCQLRYDSTQSKFFVTPQDYYGICFLNVDAFMVACNGYFGLIPVRENDSGTFDKFWIITIPLDSPTYPKEVIRNCYENVPATGIDVSQVFNPMGSSRMRDKILVVKAAQSNTYFATQLSTKTIEDIIPSDAIIIEASSFNNEACVPAICKKEKGKWTITNNENVMPDFTLVRYLGDRNEYYYYEKEEEKKKEEDGESAVISFFMGSNIVKEMRVRNDVAFNPTSLGGNLYNISIDAQSETTPILKFIYVSGNQVYIQCEIFTKEGGLWWLSNFDFPPQPELTISWGKKTHVFEISVEDYGRYSFYGSALTIWGRDPQFIRSQVIGEMWLDRSHYYMSISTSSQDVYVVSVTNEVGLILSRTAPENSYVDYSTSGIRKITILFYNL